MKRTLAALVLLATLAGLAWVAPVYASYGGDWGIFRGEQRWDAAEIDAYTMEIAFRSTWGEAHWRVVVDAAGVRGEQLTGTPSSDEPPTVDSLYEAMRRRLGHWTPWRPVIADVSIDQKGIPVDADFNDPEGFDGDWGWTIEQFQADP